MQRGRNIRIRKHCQNFNCQLMRVPVSKSITTERNFRPGPSVTYVTLCPTVLLTLGLCASKTISDFKGNQPQEPGRITYSVMEYIFFFFLYISFMRGIERNALLEKGVNITSVFVTLIDWIRAHCPRTPFKRLQYYSVAFFGHSITVYDRVRDL